MEAEQTRAIDTIREYEENGGKIPAKLKTALLWGAILDLYDLLERHVKNHAEAQKHHGWFVDKVLPNIVSGGTIGALMWALFTLLPKVVAHVGP